MSWKSYEDAAAKGPWSFFVKIFGLMIAIVIMTSVVGYGFGWFGEVAQVAQEEFGPRGALDKYEWFVEQSNAIAKMDQDIAMFQTKVRDVEERYKKFGEPSSWRPDISTTYNHEMETAKTDLLAIVSQRNNLAQEYNAASEKFNWAPFNTYPNRPNSHFQEYRSN